MRRFVSVLVLGAMMAMPGVLQAAEYEIRMVDRGEDGQAMSFEPSYLRVDENGGGKLDHGSGGIVRLRAA